MNEIFVERLRCKYKILIQNTKYKFSIYDLDQILVEHGLSYLVLYGDGKYEYKIQILKIFF